MKNGFGDIAAERHLEEFLVICNKSWSQWIPLYMAAKVVLNNPSKQSSIERLLKILIRIYGKASVLQNLSKDSQNLFTGGNAYRSLYSIFPEWIESIHGLKNDTNDHENDQKVTNVLDQMSQRTDALLASVPWDLDSIKGDDDEHIRYYAKENNNPEISFVFRIIEKKLGGLTGENGRYAETIGNSDVEHILSKSLDFVEGDKDEDGTTAQFGFVFDDEVQFTDAKKRLGNRFLFPSKANKHIQGCSFSEKISDPGCTIGGGCVEGTLHYDNNTDKYRMVGKFLEKFDFVNEDNKDIYWDLAKIEQWEEFILEKFIEAMNEY